MDKVTAIICALNEEKNIGRVLKVLLSSRDIGEVIVVDDGSKDRTSEIALKMRAKVSRLPENRGKGNAMRVGVERATFDTIVFIDADLIGLTVEHISLLVKPILENKAMMSVGLRGRKGGLPKFFVKLDPLLAIGGERAMKRFVFKNIPEKFIQGFAVETALNYYCKKKNFPVKYVELKGLDIIAKEKKWGFFKG
ncbi:MAG: glycosyltransferase family 2 protein, partial [Patescibacteria group bacterium]|nr:glycosyltransferase family 2 protein [Patescibacteria group bacterium]